MLVPLQPVHGLSTAEKEILREINDILTDGVHRLGEAVRRAATKWITLPEKTREKLKAHPDPQRVKLMENLERVAANSLHPDLAVLDSNAARYAARLPPPEQKKVVEDMLPVAMPDDKPRFVSIRDMGRDETRQVFELNGAGARIRTVEEQETWLGQQKQRERAQRQRERDRQLVVRGGRYKIDNGKVWFNPKRAFRLRDLELVIAELKRLR